MKYLVRKTLDLTAANIDYIAAQIEENCSAEQCEPKNTLRVRLAVENVLLQWLEAESCGAQITFTLLRKYGKLVLEVDKKGLKQDPFATDSTGTEDGLQSWLSRFIDDVSYQYYDNTNVLFADIPFKRNKALLLLVAAVLGGIAAGLLCKNFLPNYQAFNKTFVQPLYKLVIGMYVGVMGPMLFLSVLNGFAQLGNPQTLNRVGNKLFRNILIFMLTCTCLTALLMSLYLPVRDTGQMVGGLGGRLFNLLVGVVPVNIFSPFVKGDILQIVILALLFGIAMVYMSEKMRPIQALLNVLEDFFVKIMQFMCSHQPLLVFLGMFNVAITTDLRLLPAILHYGAGFLLVYPVLIVSLLLLNYVRLGLTPWKLLQICQKPLAVAFLTASSLDAFNDVIQTCYKKLGVERGLTILAIPLGQTLCQLGTLTIYITCSLLAAQTDGLPLGVSGVVYICFLSLLVAFAAAPGSGMMASFILLFNFLGISESTLALALTTVVFMVYPSTLLDVLGNMTLCQLTAKEMQKLDFKARRA